MKQDWYISSEGQGLSLTLKGAALGVVPAIVAVSTLAGVELVETDIIEVVNAIFAVVSSLIILIGAGRKVYNKVIK